MLSKDVKIVNVGIADIQSANAPNVLRTTLGSCIGVVFYSPSKMIGALAHIMLAKDPTTKDISKNPRKYAETALPELVSIMESQGCPIGDFSARIFGGASMFQSINSSFLQSIGEQNIEAARSFLQSRNIPIIVEDVGGKDGRTISVYLDDGRILLKKAGFEKYLYKVR